MTALFLAMIVAADPEPAGAELLQVFRGEFIAITPGEGAFPKKFTMGRSDGSGAERPAHVVSFAYKFEIAKYEVPQNLWEAVMGSNPSRWTGKRNSVEMLSFDEAVEFCRKTTELLRAAKLINENQVIRLPSEAEWEYVARAGTTTVYSFGDEVAKLDDFGWHTGNAAGNDPPVGAKKPNAWGLYDLHGYLWEWCSDDWHENYEGAPSDGRSWGGGDADAKRVLRGGSWKDKADRLTSSYRHGDSARSRDDAVGLRCVLADAR
ncbi:MAG: formylglycine-generating enzyme family protein [Planctomycetota bacterium]|nr:formylglycine-generating enzyme family protein [Planctomycetota bacterium]